MHRLSICCGAVTCLFLALCVSSPVLAGGSSHENLDVKCFNSSTGTYCGSYVETVDIKSDMSSYCPKLTAKCSKRFPEKCPQGQANTRFMYRIRGEQKTVECP